MLRITSVPIILNVDTGIDDAIAICTALFDKNVDVKLVTTNSGNTCVENSTKNTLNLLQFLNKCKIKVAKGSDKSISNNPLKIQVHGTSGMGDFNFDPLRISQINIDAVEAMHNELQLSNKKITIISLGPLTNIANLIKRYPEDQEKIETIVFSGGLIENLAKGEQPYISFNVGYDPDAFVIVQDSKIPMMVCPSNLGHEAFFDWSDIYKIKNKNATGEMFEQIFRSYKDRHIKNGIANHDLCAYVCVADPSLITFKPAKIKLVQAETKFGVIKFDFNSSDSNSIVAVGVDVKKFKKRFFKILGTMP